MFRRCLIALLAAVFAGGYTSGDRPPTPAPEVTSSAPRPVETGGHGECFVGMIRADRADPGEVVRLLGSHVPTWLPQGFGFFIGWKASDDQLGGPSAGAIWTDDTCRQVRLELIPGAAGDESPMPDGRWILTSLGTCTIGVHMRGAPCAVYQAQGNGDAISLQLVDLNRREVGRIVAGTAA